MKTEIKKGILLLVLLATMSSYATETTSLISKKDENKTMLTIESVKIGQRLLIKNAFGIVLYNESIGQTGKYNKEFDLTSLPNGNYFFELEKDLEIQIIPFQVLKNGVEFLKEKETTIFKPHLRTKSNKLYVSKLSLDMQPVTIEIYYDEFKGSSIYEKIYSEKIENTQVIERIYSLDKEKRGTYKIIIKSDSREFTQIFTI